MDEVRVTTEAEHEAPAEAVSDAAAVAVATAGAAAALAQETAAHAELQAAEEVAEVQEDQEAWRSNLESRLQEIGTGYLTLSERLSALDSLEAARHSDSETLSARLAEIEARLPPSIPPSSTPGDQGESGETDTTERTEEAPIVGAEAAANLGPAEVSGSTSLSATETENPPPNQRSRAPRRWI
jgi:hypothetical protein